MSRGAAIQYVIWRSHFGRTAAINKTNVCPYVARNGCSAMLTLHATKQIPIVFLFFFLSARTVRLGS